MDLNNNRNIQPRERTFLFSYLLWWLLFGDGSLFIVVAFGTCAPTDSNPLDNFSISAPNWCNAVMVDGVGSFMLKLIEFGLAKSLKLFFWTKHEKFKQKKNRLFSFCEFKKIFIVVFVLCLRNLLF